MIKLDWSALTPVSDLDGNGLADLVVINNGDTRIELLYQIDPDVPDPDAKRTSIRTDGIPCLKMRVFDQEWLNNWLLA